MDERHGQPLFPPLSARRRKALGFVRDGVPRFVRGQGRALMSAAVFGRRAVRALRILPSADGRAASYVRRTRIRQIRLPRRKERVAGVRRTYVRGEERRQILRAEYRQKGRARTDIPQAGG